MAESLQTYYSDSQGSGVVKTGSSSNCAPILCCLQGQGALPPTRWHCWENQRGLDRQSWLRGPETAAYRRLQRSQHRVCVRVCIGRMVSLMYVNSCVLIKIEIFLTVWNAELFGAAQSDNGWPSMALEHRGGKTGRWIAVAEKGAGGLVEPQALVCIHTHATTVHSDDPHHATLEKKIKGEFLPWLEQETPPSTTKTLVSKLLLIYFGSSEWVISKLHFILNLG